MESYCSNLYKKNKDLASTRVYFQSTTEPPLQLDEIREAINDLELEHLMERVKL